MVKLAREMVEAIEKAIKVDGGELIYPASNDLKNADMPNKLVAVVSGPQVVAKKAHKAMLERWLKLAEPAFKKINERITFTLNDLLMIEVTHPDATLQAIIERQINHHFEFYWVAIPLNGKYENTYKLAESALAARKQTRNFVQVLEGGFKDSLSGARSALYTQQDRDARQYWQRMRAKSTTAELQEGELLDTLGVIKRFATKENFDREGFQSTSTVAATSFIKKCDQELLRQLASKIEAFNHKVRSMPQNYDFRNGIESVQGQHKHGYLRQLIGNFAHETFPYGGDLLYREGYTEQRLQENYGPLPCPFEQVAADIEAIKSVVEQLYTSSPIRLSPYYAILQMDGDLMGQHVSQCQKREEHKQISRDLDIFTQQARKIVPKHNGYLIYAGGDDVLAFFPADTALTAASELATAYVEQFKDWNHSDNQGQPFPFTASIGIAFAHYLDPLDLVLNEARTAEQRAKKQYNRNAISVTVLRRSGETLTIGGKWVCEPEREGQPAPNTVKMVIELKEYLEGNKPKIASRFPYNVLRDAEVITRLENKEGRQSILCQLLLRHRNKEELTDEENKKLLDKWTEWANTHDNWVPPLPETPNKKDQGFYELARWFVLAHWLASGGNE